MLVSLLLPISIFIKTYFSFFNNLVTSIPIYLFALLFLIAIIKEYKISWRTLLNFQELKSIFGDLFRKIKLFASKKVLIFILISLFLQLIAMCISAATIDQKIFYVNPLKQWVKFLIYISIIFYHYLIVSFFVQTFNEAKFFLKGVFYSLIITLFVCFLQIGYMFLPNIFEGIVSTIGSLFEARFEREWYDKGSYVQTLNRINGMQPEAGFLGAQLAILYIPFIIAAIKNKFNIFFIGSKYKASLYYGLFIATIVILLISKTTTGILAAALSIFILWITYRKKAKLISLIIIVAVFILIITLFNDNPLYQEITQKYIFEKFDGNRTLNRQGGMIALLTIGILYPITGIGHQYQNYFLFKYVPEWSTNNWEYKNIFLAEDYYPILSNLLGWFATYGVFVVSFVGVFIYRLWKSLNNLAKKEAQDEQNNFMKTINDAFKYFILIFLVLTILSVNWSQSYYFLVFFFFVVMRKIAKHETY